MPAIPIVTQITTAPAVDALNQGIGPTAALSPTQDPYSISQIRYPLEGIGTNDVPHYVVFNINLPTTSKYLKSIDQAQPGVLSASQQNYNTLQQQGGVYNPAGAGTSVVRAIEDSSAVTFFNDGLAPAAKATVGGVVTEGVLTTLQLQPKLTRIKRSVAIYMPETVATTYSHEWNGVSATEAGGNIGKYSQIGGNAGGTNPVLDAFKTGGKNLFTSGPNKQFNSAQSAEIGSDIGTATGQLGPGFNELSLKSLGKAINPHIEMLYKQTQNRQYTFLFHFIPRSQQESIAIFNIIKTFKMYAAPEVSNEAGGRYFIPPAQFDISFYFMQAENQSIARISTCALTTIQVNYSGAGSWTTFNDGSPLRIDLELTFSETDILTRELLQQYGY